MAKDFIGWQPRSLKNYGSIHRFKGHQQIIAQLAAQEFQ